jgi:hypothetical protein
VIPIEVLLRGWPVLASDSSLKAVNGTEKNIEWARKAYEIFKKDVPATIWKQDALKPFQLKELPDVIVTETTLGPALTDRPTVKDASKMRTACDELEIDFLKNTAACFPGTPVVLTFPVWMVSSGPMYLENVWKKLPELGYQAVMPAGVRPDTPHASLLYRRSDHLVGREIVMLRHKA